MRLHSAVLATALFVLPVLAGAVRFPAGPEVPAQFPAAVSEAIPAGALLGIWSRFSDTRLGEPLRFYYFHRGGIGLYRYGRVGLTQTRSFDYDVRGETLSLSFRKSGERFSVPFRLGSGPDGGGRRWLELAGDPMEGATTRYFHRRADLAWGPDFRPEASGWGRLWTRERSFATGGREFQIYHLLDPAPEGAGLGWYHRGDSDDWSTEALRYRLDGDRLVFAFLLRKEQFGGRYRLETSDGTRALYLEEDPRNFWHRSRFLDGGRSFGLFWGPDLGPGLDHGAAPFPSRYWIRSGARGNELP